MSSFTEINLLWYGPYLVSELQEILLKHVSESDRIFPVLNNYGFYMYLDNDESKVLYIGQAYDNSPRPLRNRIRWEIVKNGRASAISTFFTQCIDNNIDVGSLKLKISHIQKISSRTGNNDIDIRKMNNIENALIFEVKPILNKKGIQRYKDESIIICNSGKYAPLKEVIKLFKFTTVKNS